MLRSVFVFLPSDVYVRVSLIAHCCHSARRQTRADSVTTADCTGLPAYSIADIPLRPWRNRTPGQLYFKKLVALFTESPFQKVSLQSLGGRFCAQELKSRFQLLGGWRSATCATQTRRALRALLDCIHFWHLKHWWNLFNFLGVFYMKIKRFWQSC